MKTLTVTLYILAMSSCLGQARKDSLQITNLSPTQLQSDFSLYKKLLQETHPGLYRYTTKDEMQGIFSMAEGRLHEPMPFYEFYRLLAKVNSAVSCAHTGVTPRQDLYKYISTINIFPFFIQPIEGKFFILFNGTADQTVKPGFELTHINGLPMDSIAHKLKRHYWSDGYIELSKNQVVQGSLFCLFYYTVIEQPETFQLALKDLNGKTLLHTARSQEFTPTQRNYSKNPVNKKVMDLYNKKYKKPWRLTFPKDLRNTAILRFDYFGGRNMNTTDEARSAFRNFMNKALNTIEKKKGNYLIIDVRANGGGWDAQGVELFTYLTKSESPVQYYERLHAITDSSEFIIYSDLSEHDRKNIKNELKPEQDGTFTIREEYNPDLKLQYPKPNRFKGEVFVLMNERSASTTSEFLAVCKSNGMATLVGEECGGAYEGGNGSSFIHLSLPHSKIFINSPLVYYQNAVKPIKSTGRGTIPDHTVTFKREDLLTGYDRQMEFVKELIRKDMDKK